MNLRAGALIIGLASLAAAHVEKQFSLPDFLRQPFYDVEIGTGPLEVGDASANNVVFVNHRGQPLKCVLPEHVSNATLEPLTNEAAIAAARDVLITYKNTTHIYLDDVWGWKFIFDENIVQFFPEEGPEPGTFHFSMSSFQVYIGKSDAAPGRVSLENAYPVVVDDQYMMFTKYVNGTMCDLTKEPRVANVYYACSPLAEPAVPVVLSIDEPYSCTYEFVLGVRELCDINEFQTAEIPANLIRCGIDPNAVVKEPQLAEDVDTQYDYVDLSSADVDENKESNGQTLDNFEDTSERGDNAEEPSDAKADFESRDSPDFDIEFVDENAAADEILYSVHIDSQHPPENEVDNDVSSRSEVSQEDQSTKTETEPVDDFSGNQLEDGEFMGTESQFSEPDTFGESMGLHPEADDVQHGAINTGSDAPTDSDLDSASEQNTEDHDEL